MRRRRKIELWRKRNPVLRISAFLPHCGPIAVGAEVLVWVVDTVALKPVDRPQPWQHKMLHMFRQEKAFSSVGLWCFASYKGLPLWDCQSGIERVLSDFLVDGLLSEDKDTPALKAARPAAKKVAKLLDKADNSAVFLGAFPINSRRKLMQPMLSFVAGPKPENYNPERPGNCEEELLLPNVVKRAVESSIVLHD